MKNESVTTVALTSSQLHSLLKSMNVLIKNPFTATAAIYSLKALDVDQLPYGNASYVHYLRSKYYTNLFKNDKTRIDDLIKADKEIEAMFTLARKNDTLPKSPKAYFRRAYLKYCIGRYHTSKHVRHQFLDRAREHTLNAIERFGESSSFVWLKEELAA